MIDLATLTDDQLWNTQLLLQLACGRNHGITRRKRDQYFCFLFRALKVESDLRGLPAPAAPFHTGDLRSTPPPA